MCGFSPIIRIANGSKHTGHKSSSSLVRVEMLLSTGAEGSGSVAGYGRSFEGMGADMGGGEGSEGRLVRELPKASSRKSRFRLRFFSSPPMTSASLPLNAFSFSFDFGTGFLLPKSPVPKKASNVRLPSVSACLVDCFLDRSVCVPESV